MNRRNLLKSTLGVTSAGIFTGCISSIGSSSNGSDYPSKDIFYRIIGSEGGGTDSYARTFGKEMTKNAEFNFQYQSGYSKIIRAVTKMSSADSDGYSMVATNMPTAPFAQLIFNPNWKLKNFVPIATIGLSPITIFAAGNTGITDFSDMLKMYRNGKLGKVGSQSSHTLILLHYMKNNSDFDWQWDQIVQYGGGTPTMQAMIQGEIPVGLTADTTGASIMKSKDFDINPVAVLTSKGSNVVTAPPVSKQGYPNIDYMGSLQRSQWFPPGTPKDKRDTMEEMFKKASKSKKIKQWEEKTGRRVEFSGHKQVVNNLDKLLNRVPKVVDFEKIQ